MSTRVLSAFVLALATTVSAASVSAQRHAPVGRGRLPTVRLLAPGAEPRAPLRYRIAQNATSPVDMRMEMSIRMSIGGRQAPAVPMPAMLGRMTLRATSVGADGTVHYTFTLESFEPAPGYTGPAQVLTAVRQALTSLVGTTGTGAMTNRGFVLDTQVNLPANADAGARQAIDSLRDSLRQLAAPLPAEPVGRGARWQVTMPIDAGGMSMQQVATYTLESVQGDRGHLQVQLRQSARPQDMHTPGLPPGATARLESLSGTGSATQEMDLTRLIAPTRTHVVSDTVTNVTAGAQSQRMETHLEADATFTPR